jgi:hypothetical protein
MLRKALAALSVMERVMGRAMGRETRGSDLKTAPALGLRRNNALDPPSFDIATGAASYQAASVFSYLQQNAEIGFFEAVRRES